MITINLEHLDDAEREDFLTLLAKTGVSLQYVYERHNEYAMGKVRMRLAQVRASDKRLAVESEA